MISSCPWRSSHDHSLLIEWDHNRRPKWVTPCWFNNGLGCSVLACYVKVSELPGKDLPKMIMFFYWFSETNQKQEWSLFLTRSLERRFYSFIVFHCYNQPTTSSDSIGRWWPVLLYSHKVRFRQILIFRPSFDILKRSCMNCIRADAKILSKISFWMLHLLLLFIFQATAAQCNVRMGQLAKLSLE